MKLGIVAAVVGTVAAATATAALASPGASVHPAPAHSTPAPTTSAYRTPTNTASSGYGKPIPTTPAPTVSWHSKPAHTNTIHSVPATTTATSGPTGAAHTVPGYGKPIHNKVITLTVADNGKTIHVTSGQQITVKLVVKLKQNPDATTWWHAVTETGDALKALSPMLIAHPGITDARYEAIAKGDATLSSTRAICPQHPGAPTCHSMQGWQVTIDVR